MSEDPRKLLLDAAALIMQACPMANIRFAEHGGWFAGCDGEGRNYNIEIEVADRRKRWAPDDGITPLGAWLRHQSRRVRVWTEPRGLSLLLDQRPLLAVHWNRNYTPLAIQSYGRYWHPFGFWSR